MADDSFESVMTQRISRAGAPGVSVAIAVDGALVWNGTYGVADAATQASVRQSTAFLWFSTTKIATATAVMQLVEAATIGLDASARSYVPHLLDLPERITVRQLLNHSSGLANPPPLNWVHLVAQPFPDSRAMVARLLKQHPRLVFEPGTRSAYSNIGFLVLGEVIAAASGMPYREYVVERVLQPIGALRTAFEYPPGPEADNATGHHPRWDPMLPILKLMIPRGILDGAAHGYRLFNRFYLDGSAYGGLIGPAGEAVLLAAAHANRGEIGGRRILSADLTEEMQRIGKPGREFDLGLGWFRRHRDSLRGVDFVEHLGGGGGFGSVMRIYPHRRLAVFAVANVSSDRFNYESIVEHASHLA
jgi:CubicO group peptidase (beta-lactamase class C family)